jgi:hypothetical protein
MSNLPYVVSPGNVPKALEAITAAATPDKVSQNFVKTILKIPGGSGDQMASFLKKIGFADAGGSPTDIYKKFRNESSRGRAAAESLRIGYAPLYRRNEFLHELPDKDLKGLILEETGLSADSSVPGYILSCIKSLKKFANFESNELGDNDEEMKEKPEIYRMATYGGNNSDPPPTSNISKAVGLSVGYNINLNLPATSDISVFNAIFKSLRENLLKEDDV